MASLIIDADDFDERLGQLAGSFRRTVAREMLEAGAKVLVQEDQAEIIRRSHVRTGDMLKSVKETEVRDGLEGAYIYVYAQGEDRRGVRNEMKNQIINQGYWRKKGQRKVRKDAYVARVQKSDEPRVREAMEAAFEKAQQAAGLGGK